MFESNLVLTLSSQIFFCQPFLCQLSDPAQDKRAFRDILSNSGSCSDKRTFPYPDRRHKLGVASYKDIILNDRLMFFYAVIVACYGSCADIHPFPYGRITDICEVVGLGAFAYL